MSTQVVKLTVDMAAIQTARQHMKAFPRYLQEELQRAMTSLVLIIERKAKELCPVDTGLLRSSITPVVESWLWGYVGTNVAYAPYVEYGTDPHTITPRSAKVLADKEAGQVFGKRANHPGTKAQPYFEPAFLHGKRQAKRIFNRAFRRALERSYRG